MNSLWNITKVYVLLWAMYISFLDGAQVCRENGQAKAIYQQKLKCDKRITPLSRKPRIGWLVHDLAIVQCDCDVHIFSGKDLNSSN